jgi:hydroxymethylpyrimidine/phosphomethylpyrimidine kinase
VCGSAVEANVTNGNQSAEPLVLAVGCFEALGRTGLLRDYLAARASGAGVILVPTAIAVEGGDGFQFEPRPVATVVGEVEAAMSRVAAVKVGLLGQVALVAPLAKVLARFRGPVVYDPVLIDPGGNVLPEASLEVLQPLLALATLVTPDVSDATRLIGTPVGDYESARLAATQLRGHGVIAALIKGATMPNESVDVLAQSEGEAHFSTARQTGRLPRGAGSAMATAIAVGLGRGLSIRGSVREAHAWLHAQIAAAEQANSTDWL